MLLVIDVGNTNTVLGMYRDEQLIRSWRINTDKSRTTDEYAMLVHELFQLSEFHFTDVKDVIISSVVPPMVNTLEEMCREYFRLKPYIV
jgi:type III pantothenate kinase